MLLSNGSQTRTPVNVLITLPIWAPRTDLSLAPFAISGSCVCLGLIALLVKRATAVLRHITKKANSMLHQQIVFTGVSFRDCFTETHIPDRVDDTRVRCWRSSDADWLGSCISAAIIESMSMIISFIVLSDSMDRACFIYSTLLINHISIAWLFQLHRIPVCGQTFTFHQCAVVLFGDVMLIQRHR